MLTLQRPVIARIATISDWPLILIDLHTEQGVVGRSYLEPYLVKSMAYLVPALHDLGAALRGRRVAPVELFEIGRRSLQFVGYEGMSLIAVSGVDMAAWDALAKAVGVPLCVLLGGSVGAVPAYNSNALWLQPPDVLAAEAEALIEEGGFRGLKMRLGRERLSEDLAAVEVVRAAVGGDVELMVDFNQGLHMGEALERCHAIDDLGLAWIEEPIVYDNFDGYRPRSCTRLFRSARTSTGPGTCTRHCPCRRATSSCPTSCASGALRAGYEPARWPAPPASRCRRISTRRWRRMSCG